MLCQCPQQPPEGAGLGESAEHRKPVSKAITSLMLPEGKKRTGGEPIRGCWGTGVRLGGRTSLKGQCEAALWQ